MSWYTFERVIARISIRLSNPLSANAVPISLSSSGWLGWLFSPGSSMGSRMPRPKKCAHIRFAMFFAKNGFFASTSQFANSWRGVLSSDQSGLVPSKNVAVTLRSVPITLMRLRSDCG